MAVEISYGSLESMVGVKESSAVAQFVLIWSWFEIRDTWGARPVWFRTLALWLTATLGIPTFFANRRVFSMVFLLQLSYIRAVFAWHAAGRGVPGLGVVVHRPSDRGLAVRAAGDGLDEASR